MTSVKVLDPRGKPLAPCHPARARLLVKSGRAQPTRDGETFGIVLREPGPPQHPAARPALVAEGA